MRKPDYLVPANRKTAIHWLRPATRETEMFGKMACNEVACGTALTAAQWSERTATEVHRVTCSKCFALANPLASRSWA